MRDLGVHRYETVPLCRETRLFPDRSILTRYLELLGLQETVTALGAESRNRRLRRPASRNSSMI